MKVCQVFSFTQKKASEDESVQRHTLKYTVSDVRQRNFKIQLPLRSRANSVISEFIAKQIAVSNTVRCITYIEHAKSWPWRLLLSSQSLLFLVSDVQFSEAGVPQILHVLNVLILPKITEHGKASVTPGLQGDTMNLQLICVRKQYFFLFNCA